MSDSSIKAELAAFAQRRIAFDREGDDLVRGRVIRIVKPHRDQPYGRSKPNLEGNQYVVNSLTTDGYNIWVVVDGLDVGIPLNRVEFTGLRET